MLFMSRASLPVHVQVPQYISKIETARPAVYELFTDLAEVGSFKNISDDLNIDPFDSIAQSVFYLPW